MAFDQPPLVAGISYGIKPAVAAAMTAAVVGVIANCALFFIAAVAFPESASDSFNAQTHGVGFLLALGDCGLAALEVRRDPGYRRVGGHRSAAALVWLGLARACGAKCMALRAVCLRCAHETC